MEKEERYSIRLIKAITDPIVKLFNNKTSAWLIIFLLGGGNLFQFVDPMEKKTTSKPIVIEIGDEEHSHNEYAERHSHPYAREGHRHPTLDKMAKDHGYVD